MDWMKKITIEKIWDILTPIQLLIIGYISITIIGSLLLILPFASSSGISQNYIDALFTSTSASTTTGLIIEDTGAYYSLFGQVIILLLFQIGALGYMIGVTLMVLGLGGKISITDRILLRESVKRPTTVDMIWFVKIITIITFTIEALGALVLSIYWTKDFGFSSGLYLGIFHSVSAFCTAGFSLFKDGFIGYQDSILINLALSILCILGAIGFFVIYDVLRFTRASYKKEQKKISVYTKFSFLLTLLLILTGFIVIFISEGDSIMTSIFQSISSSSTTGFNSVDISTMGLPSLFIMMVLMFIGASSGGTGGGMKSSTFGVLILFTYYLLRGKKDLNIFKRVIAPEKIEKAFGIFITSLIFIVVALCILLFTEEFTFIAILFEIVSALGTVGLSLGITPYLSSVGKLVIISLMLIGRVGPLAIGFSLLGKKKEISFKYPKADIFVG
ncbi:MAG: potassium transporter [Candidatus Methanofastidiosum methylothiophilum]|uniref:Potassium transporter n=1 Tax=Candidatus Methanofastidiosum methylothiophilum TaxID=1705564 RepID=A0A150IUF2_9EURY|nr:MAG: potassium transporter [Candidatus Methanofastidiosum methylthiophilus]